MSQMSQKKILHKKRQAGSLPSEEEGFEPPVHCWTAVFKTAAFGHSAILPLKNSLSYYENSFNEKLDCFRNLQENAYRFLEKDEYLKLGGEGGSSVRCHRPKHNRKIR